MAEPLPDVLEEYVLVVDEPLLFVTVTLEVEVCALSHFVLMVEPLNFTAQS